MAKTAITFLCDEETKREAAKIFERLGLTMTSGLEVYLRAVVREDGIPFSLKGVGSHAKDGE